MNFASFEAITFDCYGTLVDWEAGIVAALGPMLDAHGADVSGEEILERFARLEPRAQAGDFRPYREVLARVASALGREMGFEPTAYEVAAFAGSVGAWPPFPDTVASLRLMGSRYRLAIVSNVDDDLFAGSAAQLGIDFATVVTAQQVRSYKPSPVHFVEALERLGLPRERVLHVAQSLFHDIAPARELGIPCVWVNRRGDRSGSGATAPSDAEPDLEVSDLSTLVEIMGLTDPDH